MLPGGARRRTTYALTAVTTWTADVSHRDEGLRRGVNVPDATTGASPFLAEMKPATLGQGMAQLAD